MPQAPPLALIVGCTGAGKTTYARQLADRLAGVRFSIDEWMMALFWPDSPQPLQFAWTMERVNRCEAQIFATARQLAERGVPAMLDLGYHQGPPGKVPLARRRTRPVRADPFCRCASGGALAKGRTAQPRARRNLRDDRGSRYVRLHGNPLGTPGEAEWSANGGCRIAG